MKVLKSESDTIFFNTLFFRSQVYILGLPELVSNSFWDWYCKGLKDSHTSTNESSVGCKFAFDFAKTKLLFTSVAVKTGLLDNISISNESSIFSLIFSLFFVFTLNETKVLFCFFVFSK